LEAADQLGGQLRMACQGSIRRQIWGVADWLIGEIGHLGVDVRPGIFAEADEVLAEEPSLVVIATGGLPRQARCGGAELTSPAWDVLTRTIRVSGDVLIYDELGAHQALVAADFLSSEGASVRLVTPDHAPFVELGPTTTAVGMRGLYQAGVKFVPDTDLVSVEREGRQLRAVVANVLTGERQTFVVDHVVTEYGPSANDGLYHQLKTLSRNDGIVDQDSLVHGSARFPLVRESGSFDLCRIGDAVACRNLHAALLDAMRHVGDA
jgi:hypothetical protein